MTVLLGTAGCTIAPAPSPPKPTTEQQMRHILQAFDQVGAIRFPLVRPGSVLPPEMGRPVSWFWVGPLDQAVRVLADRLGYTADIPPHPNPPIIDIDEDNTTMGGLIDEVAAAGAGQANIEVDVLQHVIRVQWNG